ncbi:MAG: MarR family transcriptional regulator [Dehalococcoidia bacterium]|nr:MAG: MarR family transcriptional regulator [Dehalococcoidia bacterium]
MKATEKSTETMLGDPNVDLWGFFFQTRDAIYQALTKEVRVHGLTVMDGAVLLFIDFLGYKATPAEISRWLFRRHHTILAQLNRLERKGLITAKKGLLQKNVISLGFTQKGREALKVLQQREALNHVFSAITDSDRKQLWAILKKLQDSAIEYVKKPISKNKK